MSVVAALPGAGWCIEYMNDDGTVFATEPIIGWLVEDDGNTYPIIVFDDDGSGVLELTSYGDRFRIYHPASTHPVTKESTE